MARRVTRNQAGGQTCDACEQLTSCVSWTIYQQSSMAWTNAGTMHLCRACMLLAAEELEGARFVQVMVAVLKAADVAVPHNVLEAQLHELLAEHGVAYPGEAGVTAPSSPSQPSSDAGSSGTAPEEGSIEWWRAKCVEASVPITNQMNTQTLEKRHGLWTEAKELNISLEDDATLSDAREIIEASKAASAGTPA